MNTLATQKRRYETLDGSSPLFVSPTVGDAIFVQSLGGDAKIVAADLGNACNAIVHEVDAVLLPVSDIAMKSALQSRRRNDSDEAQQIMEQAGMPTAEAEIGMPAAAGGVGPQPTDPPAVAATGGARRLAAFF